jgi:hypothetical protein
MPAVTPKLSKNQLKRARRKARRDVVSLHCFILKVACADIFTGCVRVEE